MKSSRQLGKTIQKLRKMKGLTQEEFAEKIGTGRTYVGYIEQGVKRPSLEMLDKIAKGLGVKIKDLF